mgnify:CR=1 FL=1
MTPNEVVKIAAKALSDKKGKDIKVLKTDKLTSLCDYFIICTGTSSTHIKTLTDEIDKAMSEAGEPPIRREGYRSGFSISAASWHMCSPRKLATSTSLSICGQTPRRSISHPL